MISVMYDEYIGLQLFLVFTVTSLLISTNLTISHIEYDVELLFSIGFILFTTTRSLICLLPGYSTECFGV